MCLRLDLQKGDRREEGRERALTPQAQVDGKEPRCNGESEPPRRALSPGPEGERRGGCAVRLRGMKFRTRAFYEELRLFSNPPKNDTDPLPCKCAFRHHDIALEKMGMLQERDSLTT